MKKLFGIVACVFALCTGFSGAAYSATENVILWATSAQFEQYKNAQGIVPVFFGSTSGAAALIKPWFEAVAADYPDVAFVEVDAYDTDGPALSEGITNVPTIVFYHDGEKGETITSTSQMRENDIRSKMQQYYANYGGGSYDSGSGGGSGSSVITFNVSYTNGGGSGSAPSSPTSCTYDGNCNAPANTYTAPTGKVFESWSCKTSNNSSCGTFWPGADISTATSTNNDTITLTAQWVYSGEYLLSMKTPTSKKYVDDELAKKQPKFSGLGNNKLMLYSNATNGATLSRDIVTTLGDSTSATTVPTRGAINTGLNTKQNKVNGTAGWVMENTGTSGSLTERPVYSTTDNYKNALVEAEDLNQMVIDAVNSELTQVADGWQINDSVTLPVLRDQNPHPAMFNTVQ